MALVRAGVPKDVIQVVHMSPALTSHVVQHPLVNFVSFTGSVVGGHAVEKAAVDSNGFTGVALEVRFSKRTHISFPYGTLARRKRSGLYQIGRRSCLHRW